MSELFRTIELRQSTKSKKYAIDVGILDAISQNAIVQGYLKLKYTFLR